MNRTPRARQDPLPAIGGVIPVEAQARARARAGRKAQSTGSFPRRVTPLNLDWLREKDKRGYRRGLSGQTQTILSYLRHWWATSPNKKVRAADGRPYLRVGIRQIARSIGRHKSLKNVWLCLRKLEAMEIIVRRRTRRHIPQGTTVIRGKGREPLKAGVVNGVGLIRFTPIGVKVCQVEQLDHLQEIKQSRDTPAYSGPGAWGRLDPMKFCGASLYEYWRERFPGVLRRLQLTWDDFVDAQDERNDWPGNTRQLAPSAGTAGPAPPG